jgi:hypothetical protein
MEAKTLVCASVDCVIRPLSECFMIFRMVNEKQNGASSG